LSAFLQPAARAADHGDAPSLAQDQGADIGDAYFFLDPNDNTQVVIIGTFHGFITPGEAANFAVFDPAIRYRFEIYNDHVNVALTGSESHAQITQFQNRIRPNRAIEVGFSRRIAVKGPAGKENLQIPQPQAATL